MHASNLVEVPTLPLSLNLRRSVLFPALVLGVFAGAAAAQEPAKGYWAVDDIKEGMKGFGKTVMHGTKIEQFDVEVLGVQRGSSPGRDMVLVRLSGCRLEQTGVIAGMSGSPIYVEGKLLGAVAFAWPFGKEPIAGVTPFAQMVGFASNLRKEYLADAAAPAPAASLPNLKILDSPFRSPLLHAPQPALGGNTTGLGLNRIKTPLVASGFAPRSVAMLGELMEPLGMMPVLGGGAAADVLDAAAGEPLQPGSPLSIAMVTGDFDLSGIGTVTHVEGDRVYGFGHPMFSLGKCEFPMMTGYIHVVYPRQTVSFKMGSPLRTVGVIDTDVSTCVAGRLGPRPRMVPMEVTVHRQGQREPHRYKVEIARQKDMFPSMVFAVLGGSIDTEGDLPDELTMKVETTVRPKGLAPLVISDVYSGSQYSGSFAAGAAYGIVPNLINSLVRNPFEEVEIESITSSTVIQEGRTSADVRKLRLRSEVYEPGDRLIAEVELEPYKGAPCSFEITLDLPVGLPVGLYQAVVCDSMTSVRADLRNQPQLLQPENLAQLHRVLALQVAERRTNLYLRVMTRDIGVAQDGQAMPSLPQSFAQMLMSRRRSGSMPIRTELVAKTETPFVVQGAQVLPFAVVADKKLYP
jgi:hypothetical protein